MKRMISTVVSAAILLSGASAFAAADDEYYAAMKEQVYSAEFDMTMSIDVEEISDDFKKALEIPDGEMKLDYVYSGAFDMSEDGKAMRMAMDMTMKIPGEEDISVQTYTDMDLTDEEAPVFVQIIKSPDEDKYMVMDYSQSEELMAQIGSAFNMGTSEEMQKLIEELNSETMYKEPEYSDGVYSVVYPEQERKDAVTELMRKGEDIYLPVLSSIAVSAETAASSDTAVIGGADGATDIYTSSLDATVIGGADGPSNIYIQPALTSEITDEEREQYRAEVEKWYEILNGVKLFADDAVTMDVTLGENGSIGTLDMGINIDTNLYDLISAVSGELGITDEDISETGITKENSDIRIGVSMNCEFENINGEVDVDIPEITEDNSIDVFAAYIAPEAAMVVNVETVEYNGAELLPLRSFCNEAGISNDDISYDNGIVTVECNINGVTAFIITINENSVTVKDAQGNERVEEIDAPAVIINDRTYVTFDFAEILGYLRSEDSFYNAAALGAGIN